MWLALLGSVVRLTRMPATRPAFVAVLDSPCTTFFETMIVPLVRLDDGRLSTAIPSTVPVPMPWTLRMVHAVTVRLLWFTARNPNELGVPLPMSPGLGPPITVEPPPLEPTKLPSSKTLELPASDTPA